MEDKITVRLPNGKLISNVPKGINKKELLNKYEMHEYTNFLKKYEGLELTAYKLKHPDGSEEEHNTIGFGHYGSDVQDGLTITERQASNVLRNDIEKRLPAVRKAIPKFETFSIENKKNLLGSWFRGSLTPTGSKETIRLINEGKYKEASKMFLKHQKYLTKWKPQKDRLLKANKDVSNSVATRMEETAAAISRLDGNN